MRRICNDSLARRRERKKEGRKETGREGEGGREEEIKGTERERENKNDFCTENEEATLASSEVQVTRPRLRRLSFSQTSHTEFLRRAFNSQMLEYLALKELAPDLLRVSGFGRENENVCLKLSCFSKRVLSQSPFKFPRMNDHIL